MPRQGRDFWVFPRRRRGRKRENGFSGFQGVSRVDSRTMREPGITIEDVSTRAPEIFLKSWATAAAAIAAISTR